MELIFEIIFTLFFEGIIEIIGNKKIPKYIRYPLFIIITIFYLSLVALLIILGLKNFNENLLISIILIIIAIVIAVIFILMCKKILKNQNKENK